MSARTGSSRIPMCDSAHLALRSGALRSRRGARWRGLWLRSVLLAVSAFACDDGYGRDCGPGDCPAGQACSGNGECELQPGSCATDADCVEGELCVTISGNGLLGPYADRVCRPGPGEVGEPCNLGTAPVGSCVMGAACSSGSAVTMTPTPDGGTGNYYWLDTLVTFDISTEFELPVCVSSYSLGVGAPCSNSVACAPDLICHWGYSPRQCRPYSDIGEPCGEDAECTAGTCIFADPGGACARADPRCDVRIDPSCGYWLSCAQCGN